MTGPRIVIDTNVLVSAFRSRRGASYRLLSAVDGGAFQVCLSVPLVLEYEAASTRLCKPGGLRPEAVGAVVDYLCKVGIHQKIYYLWRPLLRDPKDDMVLELAVAARASHIVTYNKADFGPAAEFGVTLLTSQEFLQTIGGKT